MSISRPDGDVVLFQAKWIQYMTYSDKWTHMSTLSQIWRSRELLREKSAVSDNRKLICHVVAHEILAP